MINLKRLSPSLVLRVGIGAVFIYAGVSGLMAPSLWVGFVPTWVGSIVSPEVFLLIHSVFEVVLGLTLMLGLFLRASSLLAFIDLALIIVFFGVDDVTFRDFGLMLSALALFLLNSED